MCQNRIERRGGLHPDRGGKNRQILRISLLYEDKKRVLRRERPWRCFGGWPGREAEAKDPPDVLSAYLGAHPAGSFASATISFATPRKALSSSLEALSYSTYFPFPILSDINPSGISASKVKT